MKTSLFRDHPPAARFPQPWRAFLAVVALGACASNNVATPAAPDLRQLNGCWIERDGLETRTMRWFSEGPGWRGDWMEYRQGGRQPASMRYVVRANRGGWEVCGEREDQCWPLDTTLPTEADEPATRATIVATASALVFEVRDGATSRPVFDGARDGCD